MTMSHKQRIQNAIQHKESDRTPRGDLAIENDLLRKMIGSRAYDELTPNECLLKMCRLLDSDLVNIHQFPMQHVGQTAEKLPIYRSVLGDEHVITEGSSHLHKPAINNIDDVENYVSPAPSTCLTDTLDWFVAQRDRQPLGRVVAHDDPVFGLKDDFLLSQLIIATCLTGLNGSVQN